MKRPAAAPVNIILAGRAALKKPAGVAHKKPAAACKAVSSSPAQCKPIAEMTPKDFLFFHVPAGRNCFRNLRGCESPRKGYMFQHVDFNSFEEQDVKIPKNAKRLKTPGPEWLSEFFWDPAKRRLLPDASALPEHACGTAYRIEDNGGMPFVCYVRDDAVSVFRKPADGYILNEDWPDSFEQQRLLYTEEVVTLKNVVKTWIGIDESECHEHGNSILVHTPPASDGRCVTAMISSEQTALHIECADLAGKAVTSIKLARDSQISDLLSEIKACLQCMWVKCLDGQGHEVEHDRPLEEYQQLTLKDATQSYVYIGSEIYSFDAVEVVTAYYSEMGHSSVPYPVALTPTTAMYMLDMVQVPREQLASCITKDGTEYWGTSYLEFYSQGALEKTKFHNLKMLCDRL